MEIWRLEKADELDQEIAELVATYQQVKDADNILQDRFYLYGKLDSADIWETCKASLLKELSDKIEVLRKELKEL